MKTEMDPNPVANTRPLPQTRLSVHAAMVLMSSVVLSLVFVIAGAGALSLLIPVSAALLVFARLRPLILALTLLPIALVRESSYLIGESVFGWPWPNDSWFALDGWWICVPSLFLIIATFRFQTLASGVFPQRRRPLRFRIWPQLRRYRLPDDDPSQGRTTGLIEIGYAVGGAVVAFACSTFFLVNLETSQTWADYSGLLPVGLRIVQLTLGTCLVFLVASGLCRYARWIQATPQTASVFVNRELWKWYRHELRAVARTRLKLKRKDRKSTSQKETRWD